MFTTTVVHGLGHPKGDTGDTLQQVEQPAQDQPTTSLWEIGKLPMSLGRVTEASFSFWCALFRVDIGGFQVGTATGPDWWLQFLKVRGYGHDKSTTSREGMITIKEGLGCSPWRKFTTKSLSPLNVTMIGTHDENERLYSRPVGQSAFLPLSYSILPRS